MNIEEQTIIEHCKEGRLGEFEKLYDIYFQKIYNFIYYRTGHKETAEDLTSKTFIKALDNIKDFKGGNFSAWIYCIARNQVIDQYRAKKNVVDIDKISLGREMSSNLDAKNKLKEVSKYLDKIKPEHKEVIIMRVWDELSYREISEIMKKSEASCKIIFSRAISKLRQEVAMPLLFIILNIYGNG